MSERKNRPLAGDVAVSSGSGALHFSRAYSRAPTPVSPHVSMASAKGTSTSERHPSSGSRSSSTSLQPFQQNPDGEPIVRPSSVSGLTVSQLDRNGLLRTRSPRPKSPSVPSYSPRFTQPSLSPSATQGARFRQPSISKGDRQQSGTEHLIRQIFLPKASHQLDWRDKLPTLTTSDEVNIEIYALFGLICRQFIQSWYYKIVDDPAFIYDISAVLAHVTRQIEERVTQLDIFGLLLDELPMIMDAHIHDVRMVKERYKSSLLPAESLESAFHTVRPHPALGNDENEKLFLQMLSKGLTVTLLDSASLNSPLAVSLISSILCDIGLKNAVEKLSEPWMLYEILTKVLDIICPQDDHANHKAEVKKPELSSATLNPTTITMQANVLYKRLVSICGSALAQSGKLLAFLGSFASGEELSFEKTRVPVVGTSIFSLLDTLFQLNVKKPLIPASLRVASIPFAYGRLGKICNRVVDFYLTKFVGNEHAISKILSTVRSTLFPGNGPMGPGRPFPSDSEQTQIRATAADRLFKAVPEPARFILFGDDPRKGVDDILDIFANKQINKHLVYALIDHLVSAVAPELVEMTPQELLNVKLGASSSATPS